MMREVITRYGRQGLGFVWLIAEPLLFCMGVLILWSAIKPEYEHGIRLAPFVMTGYMCLLMLRHVISYALFAVQANVGLLYHRQISLIHIYISRSILEFLGSTIAFVFIYIILFMMGQVEIPRNLGLVYFGWSALFFLSSGLAMFMAALSIRFEVAEKLTNLVSYLMIPLSGAFVMAAWVPSAYRHIYLMIPIPHTVEMVRAGVFGEFVETHYDPAYPVVWAAIFTFAGLVLLATGRRRLEVE
jgi:capsular polysaccharide transport system permease protein